jgi:PAS domain-containing protein
MPLAGALAMLNRLAAAGGEVDTSGFVKAVEAIYGAAAEPARWPGALWAIARCFGDVGAAISYQREDGSLGAIVSPGMEPGQREYDESWWRHDIRFTRGHALGFVAAGDAITDRHVVSDDEIATHPFYADFLAEYGLRWFAGTNISPDPTMRAVLSVQRLAQRLPNSDEELELLARFGPHVEAALRLAIRLMDAELTALSLGDALARLGVGVFLLDGSARILFSNPAAERLIGTGLMVRNRRLSAFGSAQHGALDVAVNAALADTRRHGLARTARSCSMAAARIVSLRLTSCPFAPGPTILPISFCAMCGGSWSCSPPARPSRRTQRSCATCSA